MFAPDWLLDRAITLIERTHRVEHLKSYELAAMLAGADPPLLFDTRTAEEYEVSHIAGALPINPDTSQDDFTARYGSLLKGRDLIVYCSVGQRSSDLLERVESACAKAGAGSWRNLSGGIFRWYNEGRPVVNAEGVTDDIHRYDPIWGMMVERRR
ncbi:rhodanese-like domain-containing protein [Chlorobium ferrooxidans]|uniref:Rhodanese-like n=1 Tax=Chlorobium ferrooxidans DSM 13031 TaxID=377431 RepID=Q0YQI5_9CHLB|nr:rhodanese-like domain-containing protein [Chlorobium ferrooxidans]EAT58526.1 Rhodanese-like [Chlorobium ferrooxidans DSM 13031]